MRAVVSCNTGIIPGTIQGIPIRMYIVHQDEMLHYTLNHIEVVPLYQIHTNTSPDWPQSRLISQTRTLRQSFIPVLFLSLPFFSLSSHSLCSPYYRRSFLSPSGVPPCGFLSLLSFPDFVILCAAWKLVVLLSVDWFDERPPIYRQIHIASLVVSILLLPHSF